MFIDSNTQIAALTARNYALWFTLAFNAGSINIGAFLACKRLVTHITGYATYMGEELSIGNPTKAFLYSSVPAFFIFGCMISAWLIDRPKFKNKRPHYTLVFLIIFLLLSFVSIMGPFGIFGQFGNESDFLPNYFLLALLAMCSGLQNAMISTATGLLVRTTHLTGLSTDLGVGIVRLFNKSISRAEYRREIKTNLLRLGTVSSFIMGSLIASSIFRDYKYSGFWLPTIIMGVLTLNTFFVRKPYKKYNVGI